MKSLLKGNVAMAASKTFSGLNENALRYLLPHWMSAWSGVAMRLGFGAFAFWVLSLVQRLRGKAPAVTPTLHMKLYMMAVGAVLMTGYMSFLLLGLTYTTPLVSSIFISTEPVWVFLLAVIFYHERVTWMKLLGIALGIGGALLCILTQKADSLATRPLLGAFYCMIDAIIYSVYLVVSKQFLKWYDKITVSKWTFTGGIFGGVLLVLLTGWDAPVLHQGLFSMPMLSLLYILVFPTFVSYLLLEVGLANLSATVVSLYGYVILIVATVASYIFGQDHFNWFQPPAIILIVLSVYFVEVAEIKTRPQNTTN